MKLPVIWSVASKTEFAELLQFLDREFGTDTALDILDKTEAVVEKTARFPFMHQSSDSRKDIRRAVINRHTSLFYRVKNNTVELLHFWDNRRDPDERPY